MSRLKVGPREPSLSASVEESTAAKEEHYQDDDDERVGVH
jgi:hypothetical protein